MSRPIIALCLLSATISSCQKEKPFSYEYIIHNTCDTMISVQIRHGTDTIVLIPEGMSQRIHFAYRYEKHRQPTFRDINIDFDTIIVRKYHIPSQDNYLKNERWSFIKQSDVLATYKATVSDAEF